MQDEERGYRKERPLADLIPPDRRRLRAAALVLGGMVAGAALFAFAQKIGASSEPAPLVASGPRTNVKSFAIGPPSADITSPRAGAISPDGKNDQAFELVVDGAISAIVIASCDSKGRPYGNHRWGTTDYDPHANAPVVVGRPPITAWQLAVFENPELRNDATGALRPFGEGLHRLRVYASDNGAFEPGSYFRAYVFGSDGAVSASEPLAFTGHGPAREHDEAKPLTSPSDQAPASPVFDRGAAAAALGAVDVSVCRIEEGVPGTGHVTVTFANDGSILAAQVDSGGNVGSRRGACIARQFRKARVPPFAGAPVRVGKSFTVE